MCLDAMETKRVWLALADGRGYAVGSVEGRVAMEFFDAADAQVRSLAE